MNVRYLIEDTYFVIILMISTFGWVLVTGFIMSSGNTWNCLLYIPLTIITWGYASGKAFCWCKKVQSLRGSLINGST